MDTKGYETERLQEIAYELAKKMAIQRAKWLDACVEGMTIMADAIEGGKLTDFARQHNADLIMKAFQLVHVLSFINMQEYLNASDIGFFTTTLCDYVCEDQIDECMPYINRYTAIKMEKRGERFKEQFLVFSEDIALAIAGSSAGMLLAPGIDATVFDFYTRNLAIAALAFQDKKTSDQLFTTIKQIHGLE